VVAPDLLAALEAMERAFGELDGRIPNTGYPATIAEAEAANRKALKHARAAIARARGEAQ